jgi:hypothetical protein
LVSSTCGGNDGIGIGGPDEWLWAGVMIGQIAIDRGLEVDEGTEHAALQAAGEFAEEAGEAAPTSRRSRY